MGGASSNNNSSYGNVTSSNIHAMYTSLLNQSTLSSSGSSKFNHGDMVVLISGTGQDSQVNANPIWGKAGLYIRGCITSVQANYNSYQCSYVVRWENGYQNIHSEDNLELWDKVKDQLKKMKKSQVKLDTSKLDPLVMADNTKSEIVAVLKSHSNASKLFEEWGLGEMMEYGRGMSFMFYGTPGTGKTWAATCIAKALQTELLIISASQIQSSEPGGANRNIENAFKSAKDENKVLFLDECDSLITTRSDVGMILASEVNTLLTEIERSEGVVILATNRIDTLDEALERRLSLIIEFAKPDFAQREAIWGKMLPKKMPIDEAINVKRLAEFALTGGQIKNVVLQAARLALAEDATKVGLPHFESAINRVLSSKSLMGTTSRYQQDYKKG